MKFVTLMKLVVILFGVHRLAYGFCPVAKKYHLVRNAEEKSRNEEEKNLVAEVNTKAPDFVRRLVLSRSQVGESIAQANRISGGTAKLEKAEIISISDDGILEIKVHVARRKGFFAQKIEIETLYTQVQIGDHPIKDLKLRFVTLAAALGTNADAANLWNAKPIKDLWLNNVPASATTRSYFAQAASRALVQGIQEKKKTRMSMVLRPPELDDELDTYRVGTLLEITRSLALAVIRDLGLRVRICVQQAQGTGTFQGLPLSLNGVRRLLENMDWGPSSDELFAKKYIRFGALSADDYDENDDVFIVLCPQSTVGASVVDLLQDLTSVTGNKPIITLNPKLKDVQSSQGVMSVRGRADRIAYSESFIEIFRFSTVVPTGRTFFPILGAVVKSGPSEPYLVYKRVEFGDQSLLADSAAKAKAVEEGLLSESYLPLAAFNNLPDNGVVLNVLKQKI